MYIKVDDLNYSTRVQNDSQMRVLENTKYNKVRSGSTIFPKRGAAIMTNKVRVLAEDSYMDTNMMALEPEGINGEFLYIFIYRTGLYKIADTSTIPQINNKHIEPYKILMPSIKEQVNIGQFFKNLDHLITLHHRKLEALKQMKKGFLQQLFPTSGENVPQVRFADFEGGWELRKLKEMADFSKGNGYSKADLTEEGNSIILYGRLYTNYETVINNVDTFAKLKGKSVISEGGEVLVPASGESAKDISRASVIAISGVTLGGDLNVIKTNTELDPIFLALTISNGSQQKEMSKRAQGKSVVHLHNSDLKEIRLLYPTVEEQKEIGSFLTQIDDTIALHQSKLNQLKKLKTAFLQKMFI